MIKRTAALLAATLTLTLGAGVAPAAGRHPDFEPGGRGIGDPYFPTDGNSGYDVRRYALDLTYQPRTDRLSGTATISARATQDLSRFNLDLVGMTVQKITVKGKPASWSRAGDELQVRPSHGLRDGHRFTVVVRYAGVPQPVEDSLGTSGFLATDDGAVVAGQPHVAATWFPVNDHPSDKASYRFRITVPQGTEAIANGVLQSRHTHHGWTTWRWQADKPMASYLATATIGQFDIKSYRHNGIKFWDALDPDLFTAFGAPHTGSRFAYSQQADSSYKRLTRTFTMPAAGAADLSFWVNRDTEEDWDFFFVEAHTVGHDDWTTLPDQNGHTTSDTGNSCPFWQSVHPFLAHYQTEQPDGSCSATGTTGSWSAATGKSTAEEQWQVDLSRYAGENVEVSLSYASDDFVQGFGVTVDDVAMSNGDGATSFEADAAPLDGWTVPGAPAGSPGNVNDWVTSSTEDLPVLGDIAQAAFHRQPEILDFLAGNFGRYPFSAAGGIVDDIDGLGFALENQTRPIYSKDFFTDSVSADSVVVHELAHQWYGDSLAVHRWRDIWLNEGFATYAEWLWSENEGRGTPQQIFDSLYANIAADDPFWQLTIGDPGSEQLFDGPVYVRGAMTLQQLRVTVGDAHFFTILRRWASDHRDGTVSTGQLIALAERISGRQLDKLFQRWLYTPGKPALPAPERSLAPRSTLRPPTLVGRELHLRK